MYRKHKGTHDILKDKKKKKKAREQKIKITLCAGYDTEHVYKDTSKVDERLVISRE